MNTFTFGCGDAALDFICGHKKSLTPEYLLYADAIQSYRGHVNKALLLVLLSLPSPAQFRHPPRREPVVQTESGPVQGTATATVRSFKNLPYAAAPEGDWRWRPPQPAPTWDAVRDATTWGPRCAQVDNNGVISGVEDCLRLNIWAPSNTATLHPVLMWIHGGSLVRGSAMSSSTDGERLVDRTGVVLVSINYRLGAFGYFAHPALAAESGTTGNYGLLDQIAALEWVQRNIAAFGGDPRRVAIFGQSAGGFSVCSLVASPRSAGLFSAAIMMSGGCAALTANDAFAAGRQFVSAAQCDNTVDPLSCLRARSTADILRALPPDTGYSTVIDGYALTGTVEPLIARGAHHHVPVIIGNTSEEEGGSGSGILTATDFQNAILNLFPYPSAMPSVLQQYPLQEYPSPQAAYVALAGDFKYVCAARRAARAFLAGQSEPVYRYVFSHVPDNGPPDVRALGARHASDIPYVFDKLERSGYEVSDAERSLVEAFGRYFAALAASGSVDQAVAPSWPRYDGNDSFLWLDSEIRGGNNYRKRQCDFWDYIFSLKP